MLERNCGRVTNIASITGEKCSFNEGAVFDIGGGSLMYYSSRKLSESAKNNRINATAKTATTPKAFAFTSPSNLTVGIEPAIQKGSK